MDITPGIFKDSPTKLEAKGFLSSAGNSSQHRPSSSSFTSSLELLTPEPVNQSRPKTVVVDKKTTKDSGQNQQLRKSFSVSDVRGKEEDYTKRREDEEKMKRAIAKMRKLDEILKEKILKEKQIKLERLQNERALHAEMSSMSRLGGGGGDSTGAAANTDVINNTNKYLALLPPLPQLEILIERFEYDQDLTAEPIFQTQYPEDDRRHQRTESSGSKPSLGATSSKTTVKPRKSKTEREEKAEDDESNDKTDFIKRNIELVKDAGNLVLMTAEEKTRLSELLQDIDGDECDPIEVEEGAVELVDDRSPVGFHFGRSDVDRLSEIDNRLLSISDEMTSVLDYADDASTVQRGADAWCSSVSTTTTATLAEVFNAHKRMEEIEERLERLDHEWKNKFYSSDEAHLDDATLHRLLAMYTPTVRSVRTESTTTIASPLPSLAPSSGMLTRGELDSLLSEARTCLGLSGRRLDDDDDDVEGGDESSVRVDAGDMSLQNLDEDDENLVQDEILLEQRDEVFDSPSPVER